MNTNTQNTEVYEAMNLICAGAVAKAVAEGVQFGTTEMLRRNLDTARRINRLFRTTCAIEWPKDPTEEQVLEIRKYLSETFGNVNSAKSVARDVEDSSSPVCACGQIMFRAGSCFSCPNCFDTTGVCN